MVRARRRDRLARRTRVRADECLRERMFPRGYQRRVVTHPFELRWMVAQPRIRLAHRSHEMFHLGAAFLSCIAGVVPNDVLDLRPIRKVIRNRIAGVRVEVAGQEVEKAGREERMLLREAPLHLEFLQGLNALDPFLERIDADGVPLTPRADCERTVSSMGALTADNDLQCPQGSRHDGDREWLR